jgi:hypothetical protein
MTTPEFRAHVDRLLLEGNLGLALAPRLGEASAATTPSAAPDGGMDGSDGSFQVALGPKAKAWVQDRMRATGADQGFDRTLNRMTGGQFKPDEIKTLEDRALTAASWPEVFRMTGIGEGPPVVMTAGQKATTDRLMSQIGSDDLAARARAAYERAVNSGQIRIC